MGDRDVIRILMVTFEFPPQPGGIGMYSYQTARNLSRLGANVTVLAHSSAVPKQEIEEFDSDQGFRVIRYNQYGNKLLRIFHRVLLTWKVASSKRYDVLFITYSVAGLLGLLLSRIYKVPSAMMGHGSEFVSKNIIKKYLTVLAFRGEVKIPMLRGIRDLARYCLVTEVNWDHGLPEKGSPELVYSVVKTYGFILKDLLASEVTEEEKRECIHGFWMAEAVRILGEDRPKRVDYHAPIGEWRSMSEEAGFKVVNVSPTITVGGDPIAFVMELDAGR